MVIVALNNLSCRAHVPKEHNAGGGSPKSPKNRETLSSPKQSSKDRFWNFGQWLLGARNKKKRSVLLHMSIF
jgi:hypothetical protein